MWNVSIWRPTLPLRWISLLSGIQYPTVVYQAAVYFVSKVISHGQSSGESMSLHHLFPLARKHCIEVCVTLQPEPCITFYLGFHKKSFHHITCTRVSGKLQQKCNIWWILADTTGTMNTSEAFFKAWYFPQRTRICFAYVQMLIKIQYPFVSHFAQRCAPQDVFVMCQTWSLPAAQIVIDTRTAVTKLLCATHKNYFFFYVPLPSASSKTYNVCEGDMYSKTQNEMFARPQADVFKCGEPKFCRNKQTADI
jgi:hypothetical protein